MLIKFITELPLGKIVRLIRSQVITLFEPARQCELNRGLYTNYDVKLVLELTKNFLKCPKAQQTENKGKTMTNLISL